MFQLKEPNAAFAAAIGSTYLIPKHKWENDYKAGNFRQVLTLSTPPQDVVGLGPYRVQSFTTDQRLVLERNPYYWKVDKNQQRLPYIDRVVFVIVPDFNTAALKFQSGELGHGLGHKPGQRQFGQEQGAGRRLHGLQSRPGLQHGLHSL